MSYKQSILPLLPLALSATVQLRWKELTPMPLPEGGGASAFLKRELVVAGGTSWKADVKTFLKDVQAYSPERNEWRTGPSLPAAWAYGPFVSSGTELEVFGGTDGKTNHQRSWRLSSAKEEWKESGSVPENTLLGSGARVGKNVYLFGGCPDTADLTGCTSAVWRRDSSGTWKQISALPNGAIAMHASAVIGRSVYLFGGCTMPEAGSIINSSAAFRFDVERNAWKPLRKLPEAVRGISAVVASPGQILLLGGFTDHGFTARVLRYDIKLDQYTEGTPMPVPLMGALFLRDGRTIYGAGGEDRPRGRSARLLSASLEAMSK